MEITADLELWLERALAEDLGKPGDITSNLLVAAADRSVAHIVAKEAGVIAGLAVARWLFRRLDPDVELGNEVAEGTPVGPGQTVMAVAGRTRSILGAERTALNFLQRLSGIATLTARYVERVRGTRVRILDTRKTTPGWRALEKYAVRIGGGANHRFGLFDMVLIKENHIRAAGGLTAAVQRIRAGLAQRGLNLPVEVEAATLEEVAEAADLAVDRILLDNMTPEEVGEAVRLAAGRVELEASGGITLDTVRAYADTGVDYLSVGALTHSAPALDLSLLVQSS